MSMNENVKKLLKEQMWYLATYDQEPNAVPRSEERRVGKECM